MGKLWPHLQHAFSTSHWLFSCIQLLFFAVVVWFFLVKLPLPGHAVALIACATVLMSLHAEMKRWQKAVWMLIIGALLFVELSSISLDRKVSNETAKNVRVEQDRNFSQVLKSNRDEVQQLLADSENKFSETMTRFGVIQSTTEEVAKLSKQNLENITGANSYAWITPQVQDLSYRSRVPLVIHNYGPHTLTGVTVRIFDMAAFESDNLVSEVLKQEYDVPNIEIGTLVSGQSRPAYSIPSFVMNAKGTHTYRLTITSQSGEIEELLQFRINPKLANSLGYQVVVHVREQPLPNGKSTMPRLLAQTGWSDEGFKNSKTPYFDSRKSTRR